MFNDLCQFLKLEFGITVLVLGGSGKVFKNPSVYSDRCVFDNRPSRKISVFGTKHEGVEGLPKRDLLGDCVGKALQKSSRR